MSPFPEKCLQYTNTGFRAWHALKKLADRNMNSSTVLRSSDGGVDYLVRKRNGHTRKVQLPCLTALVISDEALLLWQKLTHGKKCQVMHDKAASK